MTLKEKKIHSKAQEKDPNNHHIWGFPENCSSNYFSFNYGFKKAPHTYDLEICKHFHSFLGGGSPKARYYLK